MSDSAITVAILAGGRSSRMGTDKAGVVFEGVTLGERATQLARTVSDDVRVLGHGRGMPEGLVRIPDRVADVGPLGGLAALAATTTGAQLLVLPVDMPRLTPADLAQLLSALLESPAAHFAVADAIHPLPLALRRAALDALPGSGALRPALQALGAVALQAGAPLRLENINSFSDLDLASRPPRSV